MRTPLTLLTIGICGLGISAVATGPSLADKTFYWEETTNLAGCALGGAKLTLRPDGTASWRGVVNSIYQDDAYCVTLSFLSRGGRELFHWPRFCSQTLSQNLQVWTNDNLAFPEEQFHSVAIVSRRDHC